MKQWWFFTFGYGQKYAGHYVKIFGTYESARDKMFRKYGSAWSMQYTEKEWMEWQNERPCYMPTEILLETIR